MKASESAGRASGSSPGGYSSRAFAEVYFELGKPLHLRRAGGYLLEREIPGSDCVDAMGCYPLFCCENWGELATDLASLGETLVSVVLVTDPFSNVSAEQLRQSFQLVSRFKSHFVADLALPLEEIVSRKRREQARRALQALDIEVIVGGARAGSCAGIWRTLRSVGAPSSERTGVNDLSPEALERLFALPEMVFLIARDGGRVVGMHAEVHQGEVVFGHFAAYSPAGKRLGASAALHLAELEYFSGRARFVDWGGVPGGTSDGVVGAESGLANFKRGFSSETRPAYLCGRIGNPTAYASLCAASPPGDNLYFPRYRAGEFL